MKQHVRDESDERVIHRLESFSDIVIGFSLAQMGLSFTVPQRAIEIFAKPYGIIAFFITFIIVARVWWSHHKLFTHFFVPNRLTIVLNFTTLAVLLFAVYSVQVLVHTKFADTIAVLMYLCSFGTLFALLGTQYVYGWRRRRSELPADVADAGVRNGTVSIVMGLAFIAGAVAMGVFGLSVNALFVVVLVPAVLGRILRSVWQRSQHRPA